VSRILAVLIKRGQRNACMLYFYPSSLSVLVKGGWGCRSFYKYFTHFRFMRIPWRARSIRMGLSLEFLVQDQSLQVSQSSEWHRCCMPKDHTKFLEHFTSNGAYKPGWPVGIVGPYCRWPDIRIIMAGPRKATFSRNGWSMHTLSLRRPAPGQHWLQYPRSSESCQGAGGKRDPPA
jgi:hypothetical protein